MAIISYRSVALMLLAASLTGGPPLCAQSLNSEPAYFYNGDTRVDVVLALDELAIADGGPSRMRKASSSFRFNAVSSRDGLIAEAHQVAAGGAEIKAVLYPAGSGKQAEASR